MFWKGFLALILSATYIQQASAADSTGVIVFPSFSIRQETGVQSGDNTSYPLNWRIGYITASGWYFGMMYSNVSASGPGAANETSYGNSVGYFYGISSFIASYYLVSEATESGPQGRVSRAGGHGYQFDFSIMAPVSANFSFGPVLTFKSFTYRTQQDDNGISGNAHSETFLFPAMGILIHF